MTRQITIHDGVPETFGDAMQKIATWGLPSYQEVHVYTDGGNDLIVVFKDGERKFVLGCIWDERNQSYSYHS